LETLGSVRDLCLQVPTLVGTAVHLLDASLRGCGVGEANGDDTLGLGIEQDDVLDFAELGALLASVLLDVLDKVFVFFDFLKGEDVLEDDDFVPAVGSGRDDGDLVLVPFCQAASRCVLVHGKRRSKSILIAYRFISSAFLMTFWRSRFAAVPFFLACSDAAGLSF
jgi:hypothetical protein